MSNIAEGFDRFTRAEFARFLSIARGSAAEVRCQLHLAHALHYLSDAEFERLYALASEVRRLVTSLRTSLSRTCT